MLFAIAHTKRQPIKRCNAEPFLEKVACNRWRMLSKVKIRGGPQSNLFSVIVHDLNVKEILI